MMEPSPIRDNGPFADRDQALAQFEAQTFGLPVEDPTHHNHQYLVIREAALLSGVELSAFEQDELRWLCKSMTASEAMVVAAMVIRANLSGHEV